MCLNGAYSMQQLQYELVTYYMLLDTLRYINLIINII